MTRSVTVSHGQIGGAAQVEAPGSVGVCFLSSHRCARVCACVSRVSRVCACACAYACAVYRCVRASCESKEWREQREVVRKGESGGSGKEREGGGRE